LKNRLKLFGVISSLILLASVSVYYVPVLATDNTTPAKDIGQENKTTTKPKMTYKLSMKNKYMKIKSYAGIETDSNNTKQAMPYLDVYKKTKIENLNDGRSVKITNVVTKTIPTSHTVTIKVCAGTENIYNPEIYLKSDRDSSRMNVWGLVKSNVCKTSDISIFANDPSTISVAFSKNNYQHSN
jgi:hypothetical protein